MNHTPTRPGVRDALVAAAEAASLAPSIHNTQPWRWRIDGETAELRAEPGRWLRAADPQRRLLTVSCGAALHHARVALAAAGYAADVDLHPDGTDHLARVRVTGRITVTDAAMRLYQTLRIRHTDRRPITEQPVSADDFVDLRRAATAFGVGLHPLTRADVIDLAAAAAHAQDIEVDDPATRRELADWTGDRRPAGAGVPDANIPARPTETTVPSRDFGHVGTMPAGEGHDNAATYAILYGLDDEPGSWIRTGEALSAMWLLATERAIALLPLSAPVEQPSTRGRLHQLLSGLGYAHLAIRLGIPDLQQPATPRTPRLPTDATIEIVG